MGPLAVSGLLQVPPSLANTRSQLPPGSLQSPASLRNAHIHFRIPEMSLHPQWHPSLAAGVGGLMGKLRLQRWGGPGRLCGMAWVLPGPRGAQSRGAWSRGARRLPRRGEAAL